MVYVKICGVTRVEDALASVDLGADAIGLNFVEGSPRRIDAARARAIADAVHRAAGSRVLVVGVVADMSVDAMRVLVAEASLDRLQLHGSEPAESVAALLPRAYKAVRVATAEDVAAAALYPGEHLLADARVEGLLGGTGATFDWGLVRELASARKLTLAGGLTPENVGRAVLDVRPFCVDVASGVERAPGIKDPEKIRAFVEAARSSAPRGATPLGRT